MQGDPYLDAPMRGWLYNMSRKHYWRISGFDPDDLLQEGYVCYYKCWNRYIGKPGWRGGDDQEGKYVTVEKWQRLRADLRHRHLPYTNPDKLALRHFAALVKRTFHNHIYDLARRQSTLVERPVCTLVHKERNEEQLWEQIMPAEEEVATAAVLISSAPKEIKQLFDLLVSDALELSGYRRSGRSPRAKRETNNRRFCRLLGLEPGFDLVGLVNKHFITG